jgi:hypothetical protein
LDSRPSDDCQVQRRSRTHLILRLHLVGHAIRKAAAELVKKQIGTETSMKKVSHSAQQKRKVGKKHQDTISSGTTASPGGLVGQNPAILNIPSMPTFDMAQGMNRLGNLGIGLGDLRADRATASFLKSNLNSSFLPTTSSFASSNIATLPSLSYGRDLATLGSIYKSPTGILSASNSDIASAMDGTTDTTTTNNNNSDYFLHYLQRRRLHLNEAQQQQQAMHFLHQSSKISLLTQNEMDLQRRRAAALSGSSLGFPSFSNPRLGLASYGTIFPTAPSAGVRLPESILLQQALQQRAIAETLPAQSNARVATDRNYFDRELPSPGHDSRSKNGNSDQ